MVYCRAGMSRSASLCIAYFMRYHDMSMDEAFAFVKEKRPIIHPNPGFLRQLKQFEAKLQFRRSGIKRKFEQDDFSYAQVEECIAFEPIDFEDLVVIKPRPKPRIMKPKLVTPDNCDMPLEIAQSYRMTEVTVCLADNQVPERSHFVPTKPARGSKIKRTPSIGTRPKVRPSSMPVPRPHTPAGHLGQNNIISNWGYHDPLSVAESIEPVPMESCTIATRPASQKGGGSFKKRPFSKISEPPKVAVSFQTIPYALCEPFSNKANFHFEVPYYIPVTDTSHLSLAQKSQAILLECPISNLEQKVVKSSVVSTISGLSPEEKLFDQTTQNLPLMSPTGQRARVLVTSFRLGPVALLMPVICECPGLYQKVNAESMPVSGGAVTLPTSSKINTSRRDLNPQQTKQHVPSRFSGLSRTSATRASIKLSPGVKISPAIPEGHNKRPVPNLDLDFRRVASYYQPPIVFEKVAKTDGVKKFKPAQGVATRVLWCPAMGVATTSPPAVVMANAVKDPNLKFNLAYLLTVPKRSVLLRSPDLPSIGETYAYVMEDISSTVMPHKEYPYYMRVGPSGETGNNLSRATEMPKVQTSVGIRPVTPAPVAVPKTPAIPVAKAKPEPKPEPRKRIYEPQINWAATRCEFDPCTMTRESRPMEDWPKADKANVSFQKSIKDSKYRSAPCEVVDYTNYLEEPETLSTAYRIPEKYNVFMIRRLNFWPLYQVLDEIMIQEPLQMVNMYCEPTPFKAWARQTKHSEWSDSMGKNIVQFSYSNFTLNFMFTMKIL